MEIDRINLVKKNATLLHDKNTVEQAIKSMAVTISKDYKDKNPIFLVIMNGGLIFAGKLLPLLDIPAEIDYCHATRYRGETSGGELIWKATPQTSIEDRHVVLLDDILDEGYTLKSIVETCEKMGAASVKTAVLIEKEHDRKAVEGMCADYCELTTPDHYIFGCGMDIDHYWRNTDAIYIYNPEKDIEK
ncbi:hypoxanthine-guanine phosphoribosyltransferase [Aliikangiella sp. G2MR2-5]|uniref:hypoxanthine-guanine phosphoribosyltransferase n=1 Tax=Aliikangiella sp. G2MR2-5 TaxID=2788943 RepID=UPI0018A91B4E|nr:hypoxanthine-guanine phosphoribosyltransferase [Aliikangiella sp. G2MR2-5]